MFGVTFVNFLGCLRTDRDMFRMEERLIEIYDIA